MKNILFSILFFFSLFSFAQNQFPDNQYGNALLDGNEGIYYLKLLSGAGITLENTQSTMPFVEFVYNYNQDGGGGMRFFKKNNIGVQRKAGIGYMYEQIHITHNNNSEWDFNSKLGIIINSNGFTGIGTLTPTTTLEITSLPENNLNAQDSSNEDATPGYGNSGLRLTHLTSANAPILNAAPIGVDATGKVVRVEGSGSSDRAWLTTGNNETMASTATYGNNVNNNFLGTTNEEDLVIATYNKERFRISTTGRITFHNNDISPNAVNNLYLGGGNEIPLGVNNYGNTAIGLGSLNALNTNGKKNTALGSNALRLVSSGENNIGIGYSSGNNLITGSNNIIIGSEIIAPISSSFNNQLNIGNWIFGYDGVIAIGEFDDLSSAFEFNSIEGYQLLVKNGIRTEKVRVDISDLNNWADYVFDNDYELLSIEDLELFIETYKHLPNIPSAEEVKKNGIDLAEMDAKLLEKIEELTLYNIDLHKENKSLKEENEQQQKLLDELTRRVEKLESSK